MSARFAHPEAVVSTEWVSQHLNDPEVRLVESNEDFLLYETGHIPGAVKIDWFSTLQDPLRRDFLDPAAFEAMCARLGITNDTRVILYGDKSNWFAAYALWLFRYYGHRALSLMDGGRAKWSAEGRPLTQEVPSYPPTVYHAQPADRTIRAWRDEVFAQIEAGRPLVDVRSPQEYRGELLHMPNYPQEGASRGGHIPGAVNIPWAQATNADGTFKPPEELRALYAEQGITPEQPIIAYCRIGERSSHTWFALTYLLGYPQVRNYDGSWTEWGNLVGAPIAR